MNFSREEIQHILDTQTIHGGADGKCKLFVGKQKRDASYTTTRRASLTKNYVSITAAIAVLEAFERPVQQGDYACHTCDNQRCIEPAHLYWGNAETNFRDVLDRGRRRLNGYPPHFTTDQVREIRKRVEAGESKVVLAREHGVDPGSIYALVKRRTYKYVD